MERYKCSICMLFLFEILASYSLLAKELTFSVDFEKPIAVTDEKFISLTIDPANLALTTSFSNNFERSVKLASALRPAYVRFGGPHGTFSRSKDEDVPGNRVDKDYALPEVYLVTAYEWAKKAGLDVVVCISAESSVRQHENAEEIVSFSDHMGLNTSWQLGYEFESTTNTPATYLAKQLVGLKETLNTFPRYSNSLIIGPDIVHYKTKKQRQYLQEYFNIAAPALSAITWHPRFDNITSDNKGVLIQPDDLEKDKEDLYKVIGRFVGNRPLWIAESKPDRYKNLYLGALILARRLGNAARSNVNVIMRQPADLTQPSPDYWVTMLHKTLVGHRVFGATIHTDKQNHVYLYCQCTKASDKYKQGSVTIFGVNFNPENVEIKLEGPRMTTVHEYLLTPGFDSTNRMFSENILLNNETLTLLNDNISEMKPIILNDAGGLKISFPSASIGFWVLPNFQIKSCIEADESLERDTIESTIYDQESIKSHVTRSVQDEEQLEDNTKQFINEFRVNRRRTDRKNGRQRNNQNSEDQTELQEAKDRLSKLKRIFRSKTTTETIKRELGEIIPKATSLISKIQRSKSSGTAKELLNALGFLLSRAPLIELDTTQVADVQRTKRARRDLFSESSFNRQTVPGGVSRLGEIKGFKNNQEMKANIGSKQVTLSMFDRGTSEKGENTLYGFYKTDPVDSFPKGDVFFGTENYNRNPSYLKPVQESNDRYTEMNRRQKHPGQDYGNDKGSWMDEQDDYGFYEPERFFANEKKNGRTSPGELWEAEPYLDRTRGINNENLRAQSGRQSKLTGYYGANVPRNFRNGGSSILTNDRVSLGSNEARFVDHGPMRFDYLDAEFPQESEDPVSRRLKRNVKDLRAILDQEMIDEDDANSKDCNCRVIRDGPCVCRRKRDASKLEITSEEDKTYSSTDDDGPGSKEVEVFAELGDEPMEVLSLKPEPSKTKMAREIVPLNYEPSSLEDLVVLELQPELSNLKVAREAEVNPLNDEPSPLEDLVVLKLQPQVPNLQIPRDVEVYPQSEEYLEIQNPETVDIEVDSPENVEVLELQPQSNLQVTREAGMYVQSKEDPDLQEAEIKPEILNNPSSNDEEGFPADLEVLESSPVSKDSPLALNINEDSKTPVRRDENQFFRGESRKPEEKETSTDNHKDTTAHNASHDQDSTSTSTEKFLEKKIEEGEASETDSPSQAFNPLVLSKKIITEGHEYDYDNDKFTKGGSKRQANDEVPSEVPEETEEEQESPTVGSPRRRNYRPRYFANKKTKAIMATPSEKRVINRAKALLTLKKIINEKKRRKQAELAGNVGVANKIREYQNEREQNERLQNKLKERRHRLLEQYKRRGLDNEEKGKLNRRRQETLRKAIDQDKLPYKLMYKKKREGNEDEEEKNEENVYVKEIVTPKDVRQRIFHPKSRRIFDSDILKHPNPQSLQERVIRLKDVLENGDARDSNDDANEDDKSYYAMVESLENPRIFHYKPKSWDKEKRSTQILAYPYFDSTEDLYDLPQYSTHFEDLEMLSDSSEESGTTSEELTSSRELFMIDPSEYRGGEPNLQVYKRSRNRNVEITPKNVYEVTWEPILYKLQRARQAEYTKRERTANPTESKEHASELLKVIINNLDLPSATELYRILSQENAVNNEKRNAMYPVQEPEVVEIEEPEVPEKLLMCTGYRVPSEVEYAEQTKNEENLSKKEVVNEENNSSANLNKAEPVNVRNRRDTNEEQENDRSDLVPSVIIRGSPRAIKKNGINNYLCLKEDPLEMFKMVKQADYYKTIPVKESRNKGYSEIDSRRIQYSPELVKILIPSGLSDESSSTEVENDSVISEKNPRDNRNSQDSVENNSETEEQGERFDYGEENVSRQMEHYNTEEKNSEEPKVLMVLPWSQRSNRHRREVNQKEEEKEKENENTEKVQQLEETSSTKVLASNNFDEIEATMNRKRPVKKYSQKGSLFNYLTGKKNSWKDWKKDRGLPSFIEGSIPRMEIVVVDGLKKAQNVTGSVERLIDDLDDRFNETTSGENLKSSADGESIGITQHAFRTAIANVQKFFTILSGITHALRG